ncbi:MAG: polysaccharide deacetylase family protein [Candidatus Hodarchaeota archaeon]
MHRFLFKRENRHIKGIPVLMYHDVSETPERNKKIRHLHPSYSLSVHQFEEQMEYLFQNNYKSLSLNSLFNKSYNNENGVVITFDDGLVGNYKYAFPILSKYNFTAIIFVIVSRIATDMYMNWKQLGELCRNGISIQSHTMTHRPLEELSDQEVFHELSESKKIIEEELGQLVNYISLPHGSFHNNLINIAKEIGYSGICSSTFEYVKPGDIQFTVGRIPIKNGHRIEEFKQIISENRMMVLKYKLFLLITTSLNKMLGLNNYRKIYRLIFRIKL